MSQTGDFWNEQKEHSRIKAEIVSKYLVPWANIVGKRLQSLRYLDLFSGKGTYKDGGRSTPLLILDEVGTSPGLAERLQIEFFEEDTDSLGQLERAVLEHPVYPSLVHKPQFHNVHISPEFAEKLASQAGPGTYTFIDPFGFKEISLEMVDSATRSWGSDSVFYLSTSGLVRNLAQVEKVPSISTFFGDGAFQTLLERVQDDESSPDVAKIVLDETLNALREKRQYRVMPFLVEFDDCKRDSYHLLFCSKNKLGFKIMRDIMLTRGITDEHGISAPIYSELRHRERDQYSLPFLTTGDLLDKLMKKVIKDFGGRRVLVEVLMDECLERSYMYKNTHIRVALRHLRDQRLLRVIDAPSHQSEQKIGDKALVEIANSR